MRGKTLRQFKQMVWDFTEYINTIFDLNSSRYYGCYSHALTIQTRGRPAVSPLHMCYGHRERKGRLQLCKGHTGEADVESGRTILI